MDGVSDDGISPILRKYLGVEAKGGQSLFLMRWSDLDDIVFLFFFSDRVGLSSLVTVAKNPSLLAGLHVSISGQSLLQFLLLSCLRFLLQECLSPLQGGLPSFMLFQGAKSDSHSATLRCCANCPSDCGREVTLWSIFATLFPWIISLSRTRSQLLPACEGTPCWSCSVLTSPNSVLPAQSSRRQGVVWKNLSDQAPLRQRSPDSSRAHQRH